eukprot:361578-Chlamydomonas_euryale.AAC.6
MYCRVLLRIVAAGCKWMGVLWYAYPLASGWGPRCATPIGTREITRNPRDVGLEKNCKRLAHNVVSSTSQSVAVVVVIYTPNAGRARVKMPSLASTWLQYMILRVELHVVTIIGLARQRCPPHNIMLHTVLIRSLSGIIMVPSGRGDSSRKWNS